MNMIKNLLLCVFCVSARMEKMEEYGAQSVVLESVKDLNYEVEQSADALKICKQECDQLEVEINKALEALEALKREVQETNNDISDETFLIVLNWLTDWLEYMFYLPAVETVVLG